MKKILVYGMTTNPGGVENVVMNYYRNFNSKVIKLDFIANTLDKMAYEDELTKNGSKVFHVRARRKNPFKYYKDMYNIFKNVGNQYDCLWVNLNSLVNITVLKLAKKYQIKRIIIHSHNSRNMDSGLLGKIRQVIHEKNKKDIIKYGTDYWACSKMAAKWLFPTEIQDKVKIINNAICVSDNKLDISKRKYIRKKWNLDGNLVIGNVGRLQYQKNQLFLLKIFKYICKSIPNAKLVLVGDGPDKEKIQLMAQDLNIADKILLAGSQYDTQAWYSSFDIFIFPSRFEGLSVSLLEAEANGLPILASKDVIPKIVKINSNFEFVELNNNASFWANRALRMKNISRIDEETILNNFDKSGFNIKKEAKKIQKYFLEL